MVPISTTKTRIKEEGDFLNEYKKFQNILVVYSNLYLRYSSVTYSETSEYVNFEQNIESDIDYPPKLVEVISSQILETNRTKWRPIFAALTRDTKEQYKREELEDHIKNIRIVINEILYNFILLIKSIIQNKHPEVVIKELSPAEFKEIDTVFPPIQQNFRIPNLLIKPTHKREKVRQLLIIENAPEQVSESIAQWIYKRKSNFNILILKVVTTLTDNTIKDPKKMLELKYISNDTGETIWYEPLLMMEIPTEKQMFADAIESVLLWLSDANQLNSSIEKGNNLLRLEKYEDAISYYSSLIESDLNPNHYYLWLSNRGLALYKQGRYEEAIDSFSKALDLHPYYAEAWYNRGLSLNALNRNKEAIECYDKAIETEPHYIDAWHSKGLAFAALAKYREAIECYDKAIEIEPHYIDAWLIISKGLAFAALAKYREAIECYDKALELDPKFADVRNELLIKLADNVPAAAILAESIRDNFDKLPENVRNELLIKLPDKERRVVLEKASRKQEKPKWLDEYWTSLLKSIDRKKCIPFIGPGASDPWFPRERDITEKWIKEYGYPLEEEGLARVLEEESLARVAQFLAIERQDKRFPKMLLESSLSKINPPNFSLEQYRNTPYAVLADLNLPIYITTNYDHFMEEILRSKGKEVVSEFCRWNHDLQRFDIPSVFDTSEKYTPTSSRPLVYHLFGSTNYPESMVMTETDYMDFVNFLNKEDERTILPSVIRQGLAVSSLLFIGYNLQDIQFRTISGGILSLYVSRMDRKIINVAVQLPPPILNDDAGGKAVRYLEQYARSVYAIKVYWGNISEFLIELRKLLDEFRTKK
jgi:tetratricopeptide (TPR) repeat protein